jgi:tight adherence protein C
MPGILLLIGGIVVVVIVAIVLVVVGLRSPEAADPLQARLAEYSTRERPMTLEEIELAQPFSERILMPIARQFGQFAARFTPEASLKSIQHMLDLAGNPKGLEPANFYAMRFMAALGAAGLFFMLTLVMPPKSAGGLLPISMKDNAPIAIAISLGAGLLGYYYPTIWLRGKIRRRQDVIIKAMPDALDLLTVCVEAGLGFDQAMSQVNQKWDNELSLAFGRVLQEIRLGRLRREALRDMAERIDVSDVTSFVAAIIQADQLGVSMAKVLRIQSEQMRIRRRQRAEKKAHEAPIKMLIPMAFLIFPSIYIVLLGPAALTLKNSGILNVIGR